MITETHDVLSEPFLNAAEENLKAKNIDAAETQLKKVRIRFPNASKIAHIADLMEETRQEMQRLEAWQNEMEKIDQMVKNNNWNEAFQWTGEAAKKYKTHTDILRQLQEKTREIINGWQKHLLDTDATPSQITHCISVVEHYLDKDDFNNGIEDKRPELFVQIGNYFIKTDNHEDALEWFRKTLENFSDSEATHQARESINKLAEVGEFLPATVYELQDYIQEYHFSGHLWSTLIPEDASQETDDNLLILSLERPSSTQTNRRQFIRPIEPYSGFELSVEFRVKTDEDLPTQVGIQIEDKIKNSVKLFFDGRYYQERRDYMLKGRQISGSSTLKHGFQDEEDAWHELQFSYRFDTSQLSLSIDGEEVRQNTLELENFFISLYLQASADSKAQAAFRNLRIDIP